MDKLLPDLPSRIETEHLYLRCYQSGDGQWYFPMCLKNKAHLVRYELDNPVMGIKSEEEAEALVRAFAAEWETRRSFFMGAFEKRTGELVGQVYVGSVNWDLPEFTIGYFVDKDHEGQGFITEAVTGTLKFIFVHLKAQRVRLECDDTNQRSYRVAERCGFVKEGHFRQHKKNIDGTTSGTLWYAMLKEEFELDRKPHYQITTQPQIDPVDSISSIK